MDIVSFIKFVGTILPTLLLLVFAGAIVIGFISGMPVTQKEKAKNFVDVLDIGIQDGRSPEQTIVGLSKMRETSFGPRFHLLAEHIESGLRAGQALEKTPRFLPRKIRSMLRVGEETGLLRQMLSVCRKSLADTKSQTLSEFDYLSPSFLASAVLPVVFTMLAVAVFPKFLAIMDGYQIATPRLTALIFNAGWVVAFPLFITAAVFCFRLFFVENSRLKPKLWEDRLHFKTPWRRTRMQRDFATTLALLLDAGLPEEKALAFSADATGNGIFAQRVQAVTAELRSGLKLTDAVARLDATGEFQWRLKNAAHGQSGFVAALSGWIDALDAKAFQQEQTASHIFTSGLVILNAIAVGLITIGIFQALIAIVDAGVLW